MQLRDVICNWVTTCYYGYMSKRSLKIQVEPAILKYARYCSGFSIVEAAKKIAIKEEQLVLYEDQKNEISIPRLEKMANVYKIPLAYFFLQQIPKDIVLPRDFRIIYASEENNFSHPVMLAIRRARYVQSVIQEFSERKISYNFPKVVLTDNVDNVAATFRSLLGISIVDQGKWFAQSTSLRHWKEAVEKLQIYILQQSLPEERVSAFCLADQSPYIMVLNSSEHENRRIFSLFHEIGHILLHHSGVCTPDNLSRNSYQYIQIEKFCNQFAASVLVPKHEFLNNSHVQEISKLPISQWSDDTVKLIGAHFGVSQEVIYRRFLTIGTIGENSYEQKRKELIKGYEEYKKQKMKKRGDLRIPQYRMVISKNGYAYSSFILENLHSNRITMVEAADYLDTNSRHIPAVEFHV